MSTSVEAWLSDELRRLDLDHDVYHSYLLSFVQEACDTVGEDTRMAIVEVLSSLVSAEDAQLVASELVQRWASMKKSQQASISPPEPPHESALLGDPILGALSQLPTAHDESYEAVEEVDSEEEAERLRIKAILLAQYGEEQLESTVAPETAVASTSTAVTAAAAPILLQENTNARQVAEEQARTRAIQKAASEAHQAEVKKSQDHQRLTRDEKKAKRRAACQKGERRR